MSEQRAVSVGDRIKDNDPRMGSRYLRVIELMEGAVLAEHPISRRVFQIARKRIHADGKTRKSGFDLLKSDAT